MHELTQYVAETPGRHHPHLPFLYLLTLYEYSCTRKTQHRKFATQSTVHPIHPSAVCVCVCVCVNALEVVHSV